MCTFCMQPNSKRLSVACVTAAEVWGEKKDLKKKERNKKICIKQQWLWKRCAALCCAVVSGRDDDRVNWRDSRCPLDVTTATSDLAHASTPLLHF